MKFTGSFVLKENGRLFYFTPLQPDDEYGKSILATHLLEVSNDSFHWPYRYARILKTVAYVATDEDEFGPIWDKWPIKNHRLFPATRS